MWCYHINNIIHIFIWKVNPFPTVTAPVALIFLSNLFIKFKAKLLTNPGKLSLAKGVTRSISAFFPKLLNQGLTDPPDWIISDI